MRRSRGSRAEIRALRRQPAARLDSILRSRLDPDRGQRLGLKAYGSDLNPVAVLITKALIEIPPIFANRPPVTLTPARASVPRELGMAPPACRGCPPLRGMDREEAERRIGHIYPKVRLPRNRVAARPQ